MLSESQWLTLSALCYGLRNCTHEQCFLHEKEKTQLPVRLTVWGGGHELVLDFSLSRQGGCCEFLIGFFFSQVTLFSWMTRRIMQLVHTSFCIAKVSAVVFVLEDTKHCLTLCACIGACTLYSNDHGFNRTTLCLLSGYEYCRSVSNCSVLRKNYWAKDIASYMCSHFRKKTMRRWNQ